VFWGDTEQSVCVCAYSTEFVGLYFGEKNGVGGRKQVKKWEGKKNCNPEISVLFVLTNAFLTEIF